MFKTRSLGTDSGDRSDFRYYASTSTVTRVPPNDEVFLDVLDNYASKYMEGMSKATTSGTVLSGTKPVGIQTVQGSTRGRPEWNSISNEKLRGFSYPYLVLFNSLVSQYTASYSLYMRKPIPSTNFTLLTNGAPSWSMTDAAARRAWWSMQPRFEGEVSMLNFIYELKDFKELLSITAKASATKAKPGGFARKFSLLGSNMRRMVKDYEILKSTAKTARDATKIWANLRLANEFALKPLIKDISAITNQLVKTADTAQEEFSNRGLEEQKSHYSEKLDEGFSGTWGTTDSTQMLFTGMYQVTYFTATLSYTYSYVPRDGWETFKRYWGLNNTYGVMWEALPFSFLADYFIKIGKAIHSMETDPNVSLKIYNYSESLMQRQTNCIGLDPTHSRVRRFYAPSTRRNVASMNFCPLSGVERSYYHRRLTLPNQGSALPRLSLPSQGQQTNMLALVRGLLF